MLTAKEFNKFIILKLSTRMSKLIQKKIKLKFTALSAFLRAISSPNPDGGSSAYWS